MGHPEGRSVNRARDRAGPSPVSPDDGYRTLRNAIVGGRFQPNERLVEASLGEAFALPRAVVRMALIRLEQDGLVERERYRGAKVRLVRVDEAIELLEARAALEATSARRAAARVTEAGARDLAAIVAGMRRAHEEADLFEMSELNSALHARIVEIGDSRTLSRLLTMLNSQVVRFQYRTILVPGRPEASLAEHGAIAAAIVAGDTVGAEACMRDHLSRVVQAVERLARLAGGR
jgi:DNA-binding GntR family transcriptional regulator